MSDIYKQAVREDSKVTRQLAVEEMVTGKAQYTVDTVSSKDVLYAYSIGSPVAHGKVNKIETGKALQVPGVVGVFTADDIPGENGIGVEEREEEPLFAFDEVNYIGQPVGMVVAVSEEAAKHAASLVKIDYSELEPILTIDEALKKNSLLDDPLVVEQGDIEAGFNASAHIIEGVLESGAQDHVYLETNRAVAVPEYGKGIKVYSATQGVTDVQGVCAHVLGVSHSDIEVELLRVGGAFGGKERGGTMWAAMAALGCRLTGRPVSLILSRQDDFRWTGKRHPFKTVYKVGFDENGRIHAYYVELNANGGAYKDFTIPIVERAMLGIDGPYQYDNVKIIGRGCKTHLPENTAFRGFGAPQAAFVREYIIEQIAAFLKKERHEVERTNFYQEGSCTPYGQRVFEVSSEKLLDKLLKVSDYRRITQEDESFNKANHYIKRGTGFMPIKYGIAFTATFLNQGNALVWIYADGSISLNHGGVEMGQGLHTKVAYIVAKTLGVSMDRIRSESTNTKRIGSVASTAASSGTDINGYAAYLAAKRIKAELQKAAAEFLKEKYDLTPWPEVIKFKNDTWWDQRATDVVHSFEELADYCYFNRYNLGAQAHYATPGLFYDKQKGVGTPFSYFVFGHAMVHAEVDLLTGESKILDAFLLHEGGEILNEQIDRGQLIGGFMQGYGLCTMEEIPVNAKGKNLADTLSTYKVPAFNDKPYNFYVELIPSDNMHASIFGSKGIGEPPLLYGLATYFAIKNAIESISGHSTQCRLKNPATPEQIVLAAEKMMEYTTQENF
jgi:xanthine dehydrogenase large subunit